MKITCCNADCIKIIHTLSVKLGLPGAGQKKDGKWFCCQKCYSEYQADLFIKDKRCGLKKTVRRVKLGLLLLKNSLITKDQLNMALEERSNSRKRLGEIMVEFNYITEKELKAVLSMQAGVAPVILDPQLKVKLKDEIPFKLINEFHFVIFDYDIESKTILIAIYDIDYLNCLEGYFKKIYPGYLVKFYLEDKGKILTILAGNYPGKPLRIELHKTTSAIDKTFPNEDTQLDQEVVKLVDFLTSFTANEVKLDNLDNSVWLKGESKDYIIDMYLTRKGR